MELIDEKYLEFVRGHGCLVPGCLAGSGIHAHHVLPRGAGRNDYLTVPLCFYHHTGANDSVHTMGVKSFQEHHKVDFNDAIAHLLTEYVRVPR